jgi:hypothetical protein
MGFDCSLDYTESLPITSKDTQAVSLFATKPFLSMQHRIRVVRTSSADFNATSVFFDFQAQLV